MQATSTPEDPGHSHAGLPPGHRHPQRRPGGSEDPEAPPSIGFIGAGRVGLTLGRAFAKAGWPVVAVASRDPTRREAFRAAVPDARAFPEPAGVLDEAALVRILKEPKNALTRQYQKLFEMEGVHLRFTDGALGAIAREALKRKSGARGLRAIMENIMLDVMYDIPSQPNIKEVLISEEVVTNKEQPIILFQKAAETA